MTARIRVRVSISREPSGTATILASRDGMAEVVVGDAERTENKPGSARGWRANLWAAHPSLAEGHPTWAATAKGLAGALTVSVETKGAWWL
jgi:hypothetical protein